MTATTLPAKTPGEKVYVDFDFTDLFNDDVRSGITIAGTPNVTIAARIGTESPVTLTAQAGAVDATGLIWSVMFLAGLPGISYSLICDAVGSNGAEQQITLLLPVVDFRLG